MPQEDRSKKFKLIRATVFNEQARGVAFNDFSGTFASLTIFAKPRKVAKELRRIARWLEKQ